MGKFNRDNRFGGKRGGGFSDRSSERRTMHDAICSQCGNSCQVPFRPTGDKPVFCSDCFRGKEGSESRGFDRNRESSRDFGRKDFGRFSSGEKQMHDAVCAECGDECEVPFKPSSDKPVYCSQCFGKTDRPDRAERQEKPRQDNKQLEAINAKLDKILKMLNPNLAEAKEVSKPKISDLNIFGEKEVAKPKKVTEIKETKEETAKPKKAVKDKKEKIAPIKKEKAKKKK